LINGYQYHGRFSLYWLLLVLIAIVGCSRQAKDTLVGTWDVKTGNTTILYTFKSDGTISLSMGDTILGTGTWELTHAEGDEVTITITEKKTGTVDMKMVFNGNDNIDVKQVRAFDADGAELKPASSQALPTTMTRHAE
jgi:hypothetical protein